MFKFIKRIISVVDWGDIRFKLLRARTVVIYGGSAVGIAALVWSDPTPGKGASIGMAVGAVASLIAIALSHIARKSLLNYPYADMSALFKRASDSAIGSGLGLVAIAIILSAFIGLFSNFARAEGLQMPPYASIEEQVSNGVRPQSAYFLAPGALAGRSVAPAHALTPPAASATHLGTVLAQTERLWPAHPYAAVVPALIEQESCISLTHSKCWNSASRLKTEKEEGIGLGQFHQGLESINR